PIRETAGDRHLRIAASGSQLYRSDRTRRWDPGRQAANRSPPAVVPRSGALRRSQFDVVVSGNPAALSRLPIGAAAHLARSGVEAPRWLDEMGISQSHGVASAQVSGLEEGQAGLHHSPGGMAQTRIA